MDKIQHNQQELFTDIKQLIDSARIIVSKVVASSVTALYWNIGTRINKEILNNQRAEYGQQIVATLSRQLVQEYGLNFEEKNLRRIIHITENLPNNLLKKKLHQFMLASKKQIGNPANDE